MRLFGKVFVSAVALAFVGGLSMGAVQAAPVTGKVAVSSQFDLVAAAKKKVAAKKKATTKKAAAKKVAPGGCGTLKYYDKKTKQCADATTKKG
jgi:hypothetical protein